MPKKTKQLAARSKMNREGVLFFRTVESLQIADRQIPGKLVRRLGVIVSNEFQKVWARPEMELNDSQQMMLTCDYCVLRIDRV